MVSDNLLKADEVATKLNVHINTVYRYIDSGELKAIRLEGVLRVRVSDLERFMAERETVK